MYVFIHLCRCYSIVYCGKQDIQRRVQLQPSQNKKFSERSIGENKCFSTGSNYNHLKLKVSANHASCDP